MANGPLDLGAHLAVGHGAGALAGLAPAVRFLEGVDARLDGAQDLLHALAYVAGHVPAGLGALGGAVGALDQQVPVGQPGDRLAGLHPVAAVLGQCLVDGQAAPERPGLLEDGLADFFYQIARTQRRELGLPVRGRRACGLLGQAGLEAGARLGVFRIELDVGAGYLVGVDFLGDVLERYLAQLLGLEIDLVEHLVVHVLGEADAAGLGQGLQAAGNVDALAQGVVLEEVDVPEVHADAHEEELGALGLVVRVDGVLDLHGALQGLDRVPEVDQEGVAYGLDDRAVPPGRNLGDDAVMQPEELEGTGLVLLHHAGEADDVGVHDRRQAIVFLFHDRGTA